MVPLVSPPSTPPVAPRESLLVFSDVHLGSDLNDRTKPGDHSRRSELIDSDLVAFLNHYRNEPPEADRWRMVIAGDLIDFIGMTVEPDGEPLTTELNIEEKEHGLGNASDHARAKLRRVAARHEDVFEALARFVAHGHALTVVHGNHDVEFHWDDVKADFIAILLAHADRISRQSGVGKSTIDREAFLALIDFRAWFFYWGGVAYIEHGHQYDPFCATENLMAPLSPLDPRRVARGFCDVLLRFVVRPTRGMREHGHEQMGLFDYLGFGAKLGMGGMARLGLRFGEAVVELFRLRREYLSEAAATLKIEHERRVTALAEATRIGMDRIRALVALQRPPITRSIRGILASVLLDRLALAFVASILLIVTGILGAYSGRYFGASVCVALAWILGHRYLAGQRKIDPTDELAERATHLARLLPAALVVMGHTHAPVEVAMNDGAAKYVNLGSWAEEEPDSTLSQRAARTHLVVHLEDGRPVAELRAWEAEGPRRFTAG
jgi:UDP-2,3-diacylglucosamine pyrophosphatase LpxH